MTKQTVEKPDYVRHVVREEDVTIDWFFGDRRFSQKIVQLILVVIGWFFAILPVVVTASALIHRYDPGGWWNYQEGFDMWDVTIDMLGLLAVAFIIGFLTLYFVSRHQAKRHNRTTTYDQERLEQRLYLADELYENKYGIETYELRDRYRAYGVD